MGIADELPGAVKDSALVHKEKGNEYFRKHHYHNAIVEYTTSLEIRPDKLVFGNRAQSYINLKKWSEALMDCNRALQLDDKLTKALYRRAIALDALGLHQMAVADLDRLIGITNDPAAHAMKEKIGNKQNVPQVILPEVSKGEEFGGEDEPWVECEIKRVGEVASTSETLPTAGSVPVELAQPESLSRPTVFADFETAYSKLRAWPEDFAEYCLSVPTSKIRFLFDGLFETRHLQLFLSGLKKLDLTSRTDQLQAFLGVLSRVDGIPMAVLLLEDEEQEFLSDLLKPLDAGHPDVRESFGL
ncbi:unnamed protein product, partial [Mesorhabditis spiculigera]